MRGATSLNTVSSKPATGTTYRATPAAAVTVRVNSSTVSKVCVIANPPERETETYLPFKPAIVITPAASLPGCAKFGSVTFAVKSRAYLAVYVSNCSIVKGDAGNCTVNVVVATPVTKT